MSKRPVLFTLLFWGVVGLIQLWLVVSCGFGAGHDEASNLAIMDCRYDAQNKMQFVNFLSIVLYSIWAVVTIKRLTKNQRGKKEAAE